MRQATEIKSKTPHVFCMVEMHHPVEILLYHLYHALYINVAINGQDLHGVMGKYRAGHFSNNEGLIIK